MAELGDGYQIILCNSSVSISVNLKLSQNKKAKTTENQSYKDGIRGESFGGNQNSAAK